MNAMPKMLFADEQGTIYDHPDFEMVGCSGSALLTPDVKDLVRLPAMSRLYFHPNCSPFGFDPRSGRTVSVPQVRIGRKKITCHAVSAFIQQGWVRLLLPAMDYSRKDYILPMWAHSCVGYADGAYYAPAFEIDDNYRWNPDFFDDRTLPSHVERLHGEFPGNRLVKHLERCAVDYHCFAAKNFFYRRWEAPVPTSPACNAGCLGCISLQPESGCRAPQERISFVPRLREITEPFIPHLAQAEDPIISFGQGCEGEPVLQWKRISEAVAAIRRETGRGTINLNTNGSLPAGVAAICANGLDSIRISINSAREKLYNDYYQPRGYCFHDVLESTRLARQNGVFTMINYLVFPGITDQQEEIDALRAFIERTGPHLIHFKNLNIDPDFYLQAMGRPSAAGIGIRTVKKILGKEFPDLQFGYYNRTKEAFFA